MIPLLLAAVTNATVVHINTNHTASAVNAVEVATPEGDRRTIHAPMIVLCPGGIENARLLLSSNRVAPAGLGNQNDRVGRFLMGHPRGSAATFDLKDYPKLHQHFGYHNVLTPAGNHLFCQGLRLSPMVQRREGLLNCALWLSEIVKPDDPWSAVKRLLVGKPSLRDAMAILTNLGLFATGLHRHLILRRNMPRKVESLKLSCIVELLPDPASRITLAERVDRNGVPLSRIDWRVNQQEQHTVCRAAELTARRRATEQVQVIIFSADDYCNAAPNSGLIHSRWVFLNCGGGSDFDGPRWQPGAGPPLSPVG